METWGSVPDWIAAVAALGALVAAAVAAIQAKQLWQVEVHRDEVAAGVSAQEQAVLIAAWPACHVPPGSEKRSTTGLVLRNGSTQVVYSVQVDVDLLRNGTFSSHTFPFLPPGEFYAPIKSAGLEFPRAVEAFDGEVRPLIMAKDRQISTLRFRDAANARWHRDTTGRLHPGEDAPPSGT